MNERQPTPETVECRALILALVTSYIDHPEDLNITVRDMRDQVYWIFQGHSDDYRKLVGIGGAHVAALEFIVKQMGRARQVVHTFRLLDPEAARRREEYPEHTAQDFDPTPVREMLEQLSLAIGLEEVKVQVSKLNEPAGRPLAFAFQIFTRTVDDYETLIVSPPKARNGLTVIAALGTLFRAAAHKAGVKFVIAAVDPHSP